MRIVLYSFVCCLLVLMIGELAIHNILFRHVSYSNSESIDQQLKDRDTRDDWNILFVGDSETRWGVNPQEIDNVFNSVGLPVRSFNHAFDGFGVSWWSRLLPRLLEQRALKNVEVVVVGVQMIDSHRVVKESGEDCGNLQRPVLTSSYGVDLGVNSMCLNQTWDAKLGKKIFNDLWLVRYASSVRALLLPNFMNGIGQLRFNSSKDGEQISGFEPHRSIAEYRDAYDGEFARWKAQYSPERDFIPLQKSVWTDLTAPLGFFDQLNETVRSKGKKLALFAVPTNPVVIDTFNRREDYLRNSKLLQDWAEKRGVVFIDIGIQDVDNPDDYFSDMRHLSGFGALHFSKKLGEMLLNKGLFQKS